MKILFAASDRDLLNSYSRLLTVDGHDVMTAFDGTQVVTMLTENSYDIAVVGERLPNVNLEHLFRLFDDEGVPVVLITYKRVDSSVLCNPALPCSYLPLPFLPDELRNIIDIVYKKKHSDEMFTAGDVEVDVKLFTVNGIRTTNEEIDIFKAIAEEKPFSVRNESVYISALNSKFYRLHKSSRIKYILGKGYRLVCDNG